MAQLGMINRLAGPPPSVGLSTTICTALTGPHSTQGQARSHLLFRD